MKLGLSQHDPAARRQCMIGRRLFLVVDREEGLSSLRHCSSIFRYDEGIQSSEDEICKALVRQDDNFAHLEHVDKRFW
jgi:hypothetical protein